MAAQPSACPTCGGTEHLVRSLLSRSVPAHPIARLVNRFGLSLPTMREQVCGSVVTCHTKGCAQTFCIGDGGPRDTWIPAYMPPAALAAMRKAEPESDGHRPGRERSVADPADGTMMRTLRP